MIISIHPLRRRTTEIIMQYIYSTLFFLCFVLPWFTTAAINLPNNISVPAIIIFGDSIVDTGNNNNLNTIAKSNFPPYGEDFHGGKPTGRFSNGKVPSDIIAEQLGIKPVLPAYLDPSLRPNDLLTGVNFASGAAGWDPLTSQLSTVLSLSDQLELFKQYMKKVKSIAGEERSSGILKDSLIGVVVGSNDITNTYFLTPFRRAHYDVPSYVKLLVSYASTFVQELYGLGVRRIAVTGLPPVGCLPSQRTLRGGVERKCIDEYNEAAQLFNQKLSAELDSMNDQLREALIVYIDIYTLPLDFITSPQKYGFKVGDRGCCGTGNIEVTYLCKLAAYTCPDVDEYIFWDSFHPTEKAYRILVHDIINQFLNKACKKLQC